LAAAAAPAFRGELGTPGLSQPGERPPRPGWLAGALVATLLGLALSGSFLTQPLRPWPDQGTMLQAARRHAAGQGLTVTAGAPELTAPTYARLTYFPPAYPLLISCLLQFGAPLEPAVKSINVLALAMGILGWCRLAWPLLPRAATRWLLAALLVLACGAVIPKGGTADVLLWAGLPFWLNLLLHAARATTRRTAALWILAASVLAGVLIGTRWAAVFLVPAGGLFLLASAQGMWRERVLKAGLYGLPAAGAYQALVSLNTRWSGTAGSYLTFLKPHWDFHLLGTSLPFEALVTIPLGWEALLKRAWRGLDPQLSPLTGLGWRIALPIALIAACLWFGRPRDGRTVAGAASAQKLIGVTALTLVLFLAWMTVRYNWDQTSWSYLDELRYFRPLLPACAVFWLLSFERCTRVARTVVLSVSCVASLYLLQAAVRWEHLRLNQRDESWDMVREVLERTAQPGLHVVLDSDTSDYLIRVGPQVVALSYPDPTLVPSLRISRPAQLWLARRIVEPTAYVLDPAWNDKRFAAIAQRFPVTRVWVSPSGGYELYTTALQPGR
jgi:hypothetical protein